MVILLLPIASCEKENPVVPDQVEYPEVSVWGNSGNLSWTFEDPYSNCFINFRHCEVAIGDTIYSVITGEPMLIGEIIE